MSTSPTRSIRQSPLATSSRISWPGSLFTAASRKGCRYFASWKTGPAIEKLVFNYIPASQAFDDIAELVGYIWYIDYEKRLHFTPKDRNAAPFGLTETSQNWRNLKITESRER
jgi:hypothetical protein